MSKLSKTNTLSFSAFCAQLGAPLNNVRSSWCGKSDERKLAVFTIWADKLQHGQYLIWQESIYTQDHRHGAKELRKVLDDLLADDSYRAYGILCEAKNPKSSPRQRARFSEDAVLALRLTRKGPDILAHVEGEATAAEVIAGRDPSLAPFRSAEEDLNEPPPDPHLPERTTRLVNGYRRNQQLRQYVAQRSGGRCEYCGALGFTLPDGSHYIETHHILSLANHGPDSKDNLIALCPAHHREAHYGAHAAALEQAFIRKIRR